MNPQADYQTSRVVAELQKLCAEADRTLQHIRFLKSAIAGPNGKLFDARDLAKYGDDLLKGTNELETRLRQQVALGATSAPRAAAVPPKLNRTGQIETWTDGRRIELRTWSEHARAKLALVTTEIAAFRTSQLSRLDKPDRWGSAAADTPVKHVVDGVKALIRLIELIIGRPILR